MGAAGVAGEPRAPTSVLWVAAAVGFAVMNAEIAAGRLFAPHYGTSTSTWALLIATVLSSLALGNLLGGALSKRGAPRRWLPCLLLTAAALLLCLPWLGPPLMSGSLERFRQGQVGLLMTMACLVAGLLAVPLVILGSVSPMLLQHAGASQASGQLGRELGVLSGRLGAASTAGSLLGTLAAGLLFIPWLGTAKTLGLGSAVLVVTGLAFGGRALWTPGASRRTVSLLLLASLTMGGRTFDGSAVAWSQGRSSGSRLVWAGESRYNHLEVVEDSGERQLRVNDGFAIQSFNFMNGRLPVYGVWDYYALAPTWTRQVAPHDVLLLGLGGGTGGHIYRRLFPEAKVTGVEIDPMMVRAGAEQLKLQLDGVEVVVGDARVFVASQGHPTGKRYDVVVLDAFQFPYVPFQLVTREFFATLSTCLAPGGVLVVNAGRYQDHREVVFAIARTLATVFAHVRSVEPANFSNTILVATHHHPSVDMGLPGLRTSDGAGRELQRIAARSAPLQTAVWAPSSPILTDDWAPVEWLTDRILWSVL